MSVPLRFDFHKYLQYKECPKHFKLSYDRVKPSEPDDRYNALFGTLIQHFFEWYSNRWKEEKLDVSSYDAVRGLIVDKWRKMLTYDYIDWGGFGRRLSEPDLFDSVVDCIMDNLRTHDFYADVESEIKVVATFSNGCAWVGSVDFRKKIDGDPNRIWLIDGKSTNTLGKNIHTEQMLNYAWLHKYHYGFFPERLSFYYTRLKVFQDVPFDDVKLNAFRREFLLTLKTASEDTEFKATPTAKTCKYCPYKSGCAEHKADAATRKRPAKQIPFVENSTSLGFSDL